MLNFVITCSTFCRGVVHTYPTHIRIHSSSQASSQSSGNIGNRACVVKREKFASGLFLEKTWERGCHIEYSIHGKELGSILSRHRTKRYPDLASTRFWIHSVLKYFHPVERIQKLWIRMPDTSDTCGRKPYLEIRKCCGFKNIRIRVDGRETRNSDNINKLVRSNITSIYGWKCNSKKAIKSNKYKFLVTISTSSSH